MKNTQAFVVMLLSLIVLDALWIFGFMQGLYQREIPDLLRADPNWIAALIFYVGYPIGAIYLAVLPALELHSLRKAIVNGAALGGVAYGTFAITNLSVIKGWSVALTIADGFWGVVVTAAVSALGYLVARRGANS